MAVLRYVSDLHLERISRDLSKATFLRSLYNFDREKNTKYYLALVGDIGNPIGDARKRLIQFYNLIHPHYTKIFYVMGNHEYYCKEGYSMEYIRSKLKKSIKGFPKIVILDNESFEIENIRILGSTLWSRVDPKNEADVMKYINDYKMIHVSNDSEGDQCKINNHSRKITVQETNELNRIAREWLEKEIQSSDKPCIVLTHHAPLYSNITDKKYTCDPMYAGKSTNDAFHNDLDSFIKKPMIAWIYGHTHYVSSFTHNDVLILTNQKGYEFECTGYVGVKELDLVDEFVNSI